MKKKTVIVLTICLATCLMLFYYHQFILSPNSFLASDSGDGIKAYTVFAGHIKNDSDYTNYQNLNYPYTQTHIFTDGQTIIADIFKLFSKYSPFFITHSVALYNLMMIFSFVGCAFFLCLILQKLQLPTLFVILGSVGITMMSPQVFRMGGHLTLSYTVFFPLSWWLFIRLFESKNKILFSFLIIINSTLWFFVHPYYMMINTIFYASCYFVILIQRNKYFTNNIYKTILALLQLSGPLILTRIYVASVDTHQFRSEHPWGFWELYAKINTVFVPTHPPFGKLIQNIFSIHDQNWEGWAYIGLPSVFIAFYSIFRIFRYLWRKNISSIITPVLPGVLQPALLAAVITLAFSMCIPFRLNLDWLVDHLGFLQQFRSLGRFVWIFYYVFTVYSIYVSYLIFRKWKMKKRTVLAYIYCTILFSFFFIESYAYHRENADRMIKTKNYFNHDQLTENYKQAIDTINTIKSKYQCIIPLPFYYVGNENFEKIADGLVLGSMVVSYWTNMPLLSSFSARSPIIEGKNVMQFFSPPFFTKAIQKDLPDKKPFLILYDHEDLTMIEYYWLMRSRKISQNENFELWELPYDSVFNSTAEREIQHFNAIKKDLKEVNSFFCSNDSDAVVYKTFSDLVSPHVFSHKEVLIGIKKNYTFLLEKTSLNLKPDRDYIVSFWYYNKGELRNQNMCVVGESDSLGKNEEWNISWSPTTSMTIDGDWSLVEKRFRVKSRNEMISVFMIGDARSEQEVYVTNFLLRQADNDVYQEIKKDSSNRGERIIKNNILISQDPH